MAGTWARPSGHSGARLRWTPPSGWPTTSSRSPEAGLRDRAIRSAWKRIRQATRFADRLPEHDRAMVGRVPALPRRRLRRAGARRIGRCSARDSTDADAWYGLGDVTFHDPARKSEPARMTESLRAFKRAIALDPDYYLAYEHLAQIYRWGAADRPWMALLPGDSITLTQRRRPAAGPRFPRAGPSHPACPGAGASPVRASG